MCIRDRYIFGTNGQGQDVFAQTICGARQTLFVGFSAGILVVIIGALIGGIAGFYGGRIDDILSLLIPLRISLVLHFLLHPLNTFLEQMVKDKMYSHKRYAEQGRRFLSDLAQAFLL